MANYFNGYLQPQYQPQYQQQQQNNPVIVVPVQGEQGANIYPVAAGNTVFLFDFNSQKFWVKSTDINGLPAKFSAFTFKEEVKPSNDTSNFVSRNEFEEFGKHTTSQLEKILATINALVGGKDNVSTNS